MSKKILVIDDEPEIVTVLRMRLESQKYSVVAANDGIEGLKKVSEEKPDLIILDILMPRMDGFTFLLELKKVHPDHAVPVIVLTAKEMMSDLFKLEGVHDYVLKPFEADDLLARIRKYI